MIELDPGKVSAHYIEPAVSHETGTEVKVETKQEYHKAPVIEETDIKYKKVGHLMNIFTDEEKKYIWEQCLQTPNPFRCKAMTTHTCYQETHCGNAWVGTRNNLFWVYNSHYKTFLSYDSRMESIKEWLEKYKTYRYNNSCSQMITRSRYCVSWCNDRVPNCKNTFIKFKNW